MLSNNNFFLIRQKFISNRVAIIKSISLNDGEIKDFIKKMSRLHDKLCEIMENVNLCCSFQVIFFLPYFICELSV